MKSPLSLTRYCISQAVMSGPVLAGGLRPGVTPMMGEYVKGSASIGTPGGPGGSSTSVTETRIRCSRLRSRVPMPLVAVTLTTYRLLLAAGRSKSGSSAKLNSPRLVISNRDSSVPPVISYPVM